MLRIQHIMDEESRELELNDVFMEALALSGSCANEKEESYNRLYKLLKEDNELIETIKDEFKYKILEIYDYEILQ